VETTYKIIGGDGREYGPIALDELKNWIRDGRVAGGTPVWRSDNALWSPAAQFAELRADIGQLVAAAGLAAVNAAAPVGFWARLGAYIVDRIVMWLLCTFIWTAIAALMQWKFPEPPPNMQTFQELINYFQSLGPLVIYQMIVVFVCGFVYEVVFNGTWGATLGKMAIGARIVRVDGSRIRYGIAALRWLAERLSDLTFCVGYLMIGFRADKRAMHDLIAGTRVIFVR
jgi:uncharacterized RDD family membrane protein YckC